jgi:uncharacterized HhH-GPD family protein
VQIAQDEAADAFLAADPFALLVGMLLDQQIPMEKAFSGPALIASRLGVPRLDPVVLAGLDEARVVEIMAGPPAVHRFPASMGARLQALARAVTDEHGAEVTRIWEDADAATVLRRLKGLPGFGEQKAKIFLALLGKQVGVQPAGWVEVTAPYGEPGCHRSVADVVDRESLTRVREFKREAKARAKAAPSS